MPDPSPFALLLRRIRGERKQQAMAEALMAALPPREFKLSRQHVWNYETGLQRPPADVLDAYAALAPELAAELLRLAGLGRAVDAIQDSDSSAA